MGKVESVPLGEVVTIDRVGVPSAKLEDELYVSLEDIDSLTGTVQPEARDPSKSTKFEFGPDHVLYGKLRPYLGKVARPIGRGYCSTDILPIRPSPRLDRNYLFHFLRSREFTDKATQAAVGVNLPRISPDILLTFAIPLPPLDEQRRIAAILDKADELRAKRRVALKKLDDLTQSIFLDLFGDPATNPKGWPMKPFGEICETRLGKMLDQKQQTGQHLRPYLRNANVQWFKFDLAEVFEMDFDEKARKLFRLEVGDLLICEGGEPGRAAVWHGEIAECYYQKALHRARPRRDLAMADFLAWQLWFLAQGGGLGDHVTAATIAHLTGEKLNAMKVPLPPIALQREFAKRMTAVEKLKAAQRASLAELDALFASFQHRAFQGEL